MLMHKKKKVRILSLGTGEMPFGAISSKYSWDKKSYGLYKSEFMMNMDNYAAEYWLRQQMAYEGRPNDFLRVQKYNITLSMDSIEQSNIDRLIETGTEIYGLQKKEIQAFVANIIDEKYGG